MSNEAKEIVERLRKAERDLEWHKEYRKSLESYSERLAKELASEHNDTKDRRLILLREQRARIAELQARHHEGG